MLQIFVDDPLWFVRGTKERRRRLVVILLLFWQAFGFPFSWPRGAAGPETIMESGPSAGSSPQRARRWFAAMVSASGRAAAVFSRRAVISLCKSRNKNCRY
mgnify:CR=1 FL=1